jgi:ABC-2 type transport system ATP-binding protein
MAMIEIDRLVKRFGGFTAVDGVSFAVEKGTVLGFLGPNGAGKSTTMKMITGFLAPTSGTARVCGIDVGDRPRDAKARLGYLPEGAPTYPDMTPAGFLDFCAEARGLPKAARAEKVARAAALTELQEVMHQPVETLSKGFKRRVGLAQAILHDPEVLILDEPTDGLDPNQKHHVRQLIRAMAADKAIIISTHILEEVEAACDRAIIIGGGRILAEGAPAGPDPQAGWRFGERVAAPGRLDAVFRDITLGPAQDQGRAQVREEAQA